jgi:hypothetical protein
MTDPNPLKQAAEEAKARKLAEVAAHDAKLREQGPFEEFEVMGPPSLLQMGWANLETIASQRNIFLSAPVRELWQDMLRNEESGESWVAVIRPREPGTIPQMLQRLERAGLKPAGLRELLTYEWQPSKAAETLWALGARAPLGTATMSPYRMKRGGIDSVLGHSNASATDTTLTDRHAFLVRLDSKTIDSIAKARQPRP